MTDYTRYPIGVTSGALALWCTDDSDPTNPLPPLPIWTEDDAAEQVTELTLANLVAIAEQHEGERHADETPAAPTPLRDAIHAAICMPFHEGSRCGALADLAFVPVAAELAKAHEAVDAAVRRAQLGETHLRSATALVEALRRCTHFYAEHTPDGPQREPWRYAAYMANRLFTAVVGDPDPRPEHFSSGESALSWHTVRLFDGADVFDANVVVRQYDVEHPAECHALPEGAACWFDRYMEQQPRDADWPTEVGTYRMRLETRITGGREEPDYTTFLQVEPVVADLGTFERLAGAPAKPEPDLHYTLDGVGAACGIHPAGAPGSEIRLAFDPQDDGIACPGCRTYLAGLRAGKGGE